MAGVLKQWIIDSEKFEMQRSYHVLNIDNFSFLNRQDDFYITLLNRLFFLLEETIDFNSKSDELLELAKGLLIYSDRDTNELFDRIDKIENILYVATIYYLVGYEAIASLLLKNLDIEIINNRYGRLIAYLIKGANQELSKINDKIEEKLFDKLDSYIVSGDNDKLTYIIEHVEKQCESLKFEKLDEFFDCYILKHLLRKFSMDNIWLDLTKADPNTDWSEYIGFSRSQGILQFLPSQRDAISKGLLTFNRAFSLKMPTSAGKSYITELLIYSELKKNPKAKVLYLAPLRSLSHELSNRYEKVGNALSFESFAAYGGNSSTLDNNRLDNAGLFITTPEFFASLEGGDEDLLDKFTLVICDEGQLLDSITRGTNYELLLSRIKSKGVARFLFISAIIPNIEDVNTWLGGSKFEIGDSSYRPCEIKLAKAEKNSRNISLHVYSSSYNEIKFDIESFLDKEENRKVAINNKVTLCSALGLKALSAGSTLIFTYSKGGKYGCDRVCGELLTLVNMHRYREVLIDRNNAANIEKLSTYVSYQYGEDYPLSKYIKAGFAYHNGGLPQDIREYIEDFYRNKWLKLLVSNSTLAEGVNLPIRTLIVYHLRRFNFRTRMWELIDSTEIRNILGRVGRAGREKYGLVILPDNNQEVYDTVVEALKGDNIHAIRGIFYDVIQILSKQFPEVTDEQVNSVLMQIGASSAIDQMIYRHYGESQEDMVENSISDSLAYHLSDEDSKHYLRQAFRVRQAKIADNINDSERLVLLKKTGLELEDFVKIEESIKEEDLVKFKAESVSDINWLCFLLTTVYSLPSIVTTYSYMDNEIKEVIDDKNKYAGFVNMWLYGKQYWQISEEIGLQLDNVMELLAHFQYHFHMRLQGLIRYLGAKYEFKDDNLSLLPECVKYGINSSVHTTLIKGGLRDRIALHTVSQYLDNQSVICANSWQIKRELRSHETEFTKWVAKCKIPILSQKKLFAWLG